MSTPETNSLFEYFDRIISATRAGTMEWTKANPTTFIWNSPQTPAARIVLQQIDRQVRVRLQTGSVGSRNVKSYVFQALDAQGQQKLSASGADDSATNDKLEAIFNAISLNFSRKGLEFLESLLPPQ